MRSHHVIYSGGESGWLNSINSCSYEYAALLLLRDTASKGGVVPEAPHRRSFPLSPNATPNSHEKQETSFGAILRDTYTPYWFVFFFLHENQPAIPPPLPKLSARGFRVAGDSVTPQNIVRDAVPGNIVQSTAACFRGNLVRIQQQNGEWCGGWRSPRFYLQTNHQGM